MAKKYQIKLVSLKIKLILILGQVIGQSWGDMPVYGYTVENQ